jgi:hypothetical protein
VVNTYQNDLQELISLWHIRPGMSWADDPYDNAFAESFWIGLPKQPLESGSIGRRNLEPRSSIGPPVRYIEMYYNRVRKY